MGYFNSYGQESNYPKVDFFEKKEITLELLIKKIESNTEYNCIYTDELLKEKEVLRLPKETLRLDLFLSEIFKVVPIEFKIVNKQIILSRKINKNKKITVSGIIRDKETGEGLIRANVYDVVNRQGVCSNNHGFYSISFSSDTTSLRFSYVGYKPKYIRFDQQNTEESDIELNIYLDQSLLDEIEVKNVKEYETLKNATPGEVDFPIQKIRRLPLLFGDADPLKALQLFSGVQSGRNDTGYLHVRGGSKDQNLILVDGTTIYQPYHSLGVLSVFNDDAIKNVRLIKSGFPAQYGGRSSSVLDVTLKDGNKRKFSGSVEVGERYGKGLLEGPIIKDKLSFMGSYRRSISDFFDNLAKYYSEEYVTSSFFDIFGKISFQAKVKTKINFSLYHGGDETKRIRQPYTINLSPVSEESNNWRNTVLTFEVDQQLSKKLFANINFNYNSYIVSEGLTQSIFFGDSIILSNSMYIKGYGTRAIFDLYPSPNHTMKFGVEGIYYRTKPEFDSRISDEQENLIQKRLYTEVFDMNAFVEDKIDFSDKLHVTAGLRVNSFFKKGYQYFSLQPRLSFSYLLRKNVALKGGMSKMNQFFHLITYQNNSFLPNEMWLSSNKDLKPQSAYESSVGIDWQLQKWSFSANSYFKYFSNLVSQNRSLLSTIGFENNPENLENVFDIKSKGYGYGFEFSISKTKGKTRGWINYTYSRSFRKILNQEIGKEYHPYEFDRPNDFSFVFIQDIKKNKTITLSWVYFDGENITVPSRIYTPVNPVDDEPILDFEKVNNYRLDPCHRLDFAIHFYKKRRWWLRTWIINLYNLYGKRNPYNTSFDINSSGGVSLVTASLFGIRPSIKYRIEF